MTTVTVPKFAVTQSKARIKNISNITERLPTHFRYNVAEWGISEIAYCFQSLKIKVIFAVKNTT